MLRTGAFVCLVAAVAIAARAGADVLWPRVRSRVARAEREYEAQLKDLFRPMASARLIALAQYLGSVVIALLLLLSTGNVVLALAVPAAGFLLPGVLFARLRRQRLDRINRQLPDTLRVMADAARAGLSLPEMIRLVAAQGPKPAAEEFGLIVHAMDLGAPVEDALKRAGARLSLPNFTLVSTAILVNRERGGDIGALLVRLGEAIGAISAVEERIETETASVRFSAKIMILTIPLFGLVLFIMDSAAMATLFTTVRGAVVLVVVAALAISGYRMIQRLANPEV
jgi:tight adherence protein B